MKNNSPTGSYMSDEVLISPPSSTKHLVLMEDTKNWCFVARVPKFPVPWVSLNLASCSSQLRLTCHPW